MKKTKLLSLTALALIGLLGLSSCGSNEVIEGPEGPQGPQGPAGEDGTDGKDGIDGSTWLTGTGAPKDTDGKTNDMYLNTTNGDVYQKQADGSWKLIMNIKGEDGEDGKDGANGSNGSTGPKGETAWSNTILPSEGGYVVPSVGSAVEGEEISFTITPLANYVLTSFSLNNENVTPTINEDKTSYIYETSMVEHGFVVSATFSAKTGQTGFIDGVQYNDVVKDGYGNVFSHGEKVTDGASFAGGSGSEADPLQINDPSMLTSDNLQKSGESNFILTEDITLTTALPLVSSDGDNEVKETNINLGGNTLTTAASTVALDENDSLKIENGTLNIPTTGTTSAIAATKGSSVELNGVTLNAGSGVGIWDSAVSVDIINSTINASTFGVSTNATNWEEAKDIEINIINSKISTLNENSGDNTAVMCNIDATVNIIENSTLEGARQALIVRSGTVNVSDSTIRYNTRYSVDGSDPNKDGYDEDYYNDHAWGDGNRVATAGIVVGDYQNNAYDVPCTLNLTNVIYEEEKYVADEATTLADFDKPNKDKLYQLYINGEKEETPASVNMDSFTYDQFDPDRIFVNEFGSLKVDGGIQKSGENVFINGVLYEHATYSDNNGVYTLVEDASTNKVSELNIKFSDGSGTETDPLIISSDAQFQLLNKIPDVANPTFDTYKTIDSLYFKLSKDIEVSAPISYFNGHLDGDNHKITFGSRFDCKNLVTKSLFNNVYGKNVSFKNLSFNMHDNQNIVLMNNIWNKDFYLHNVDLENVDFNVLDSHVLNVNSGNFGFVTDNAPYTGNDTEDVTWSFKDVDINGSVNNIGTCTSVYIGSGPCPAGEEKVYNIKLEFTDCDVIGDFNSFEQVGIFYGNGKYYTDSTKMTDKILATNCTFTGKAFADKANVFSYTNDEVKAIASALIDNGLAVSGEGINEGYDKVEGDIYLTYKDGSFVTNLEANENSSYSLIFSVNKIVVDSENHVSNGRKIMFDLGEDLTLSETTIKDVKAISSEDYKKEVDTSYVGSFNLLLENWRVDVVVKEDVVYIIFDSNQSNFVSVDEATKAYVVEKQDGKIVKRSTITFN